MKKRVLLLFLTVLLTIPFATKHMAQCTSGTLSNPVVTPSTCNDNGKVKVDYTIGGGASQALLYLYKEGVANPVASTVVSGSSGTHTFESLFPGNYTIKLLCSENLSQIYAELQVTVDAPPPLNLTMINDRVTASGLCSDFTQGGVIEVADLTGVGGDPPYQVSIIKNDDTGYDDALSQYVTPPGYPYRKTVTEFGKYQIRVKDACGTYTTVTRDMQPSQPPLRLEWRPRKKCDGTTEGRFAFLYAGNTDNVLQPEPFFHPGIKLVVRADNQSGAVLFDGIFNGPPFIYTATPSHKYHVTTTNACGIEHRYILDLNKYDFGELLDFKVKTFLSGCGSSQKMNILVDMVTVSYWPFPVTIEIKNSNGTIVSTKVMNDVASWTVKDLVPGNYSVTVRDACGFEMTKPADQAQPVPLSLVGNPYLVKWACSSAGGQLTQTGTIQVLLLFNGIVDPNAEVTIVAGPSNVGVRGVFDPSNNRYGWTNMLPGNYTVEVVQCEIAQQFDFTVNSNNLLKQSISSTGNSVCSGGGTITSVIDYNGRGRILVELLNEQDQVIQSNATGTFINLPAGKYRTRLKIDYCGFYYIDDEHWVTLTDASTGPKILNSTGLICEAPDGTPQNTGNAYLNLSGVPPLVLTYKEQGSSTIYDVPINPSLSSLSLTVEGLTANITYQFVLRDGCGGSTPINVTVQTLSKTLTVANTVQPCYNQPYTLSMPYYPQASYVWKNPSNAVVSTHRDFQIANYTEAYDGVYTCDISWGNCLSRFVQVRLDGKACGTPLNNYWIGTTDNVWNKDENWTGNKIPPTEADVEFATVDNNNGNPAVRDLHVPVDDPKVIGNLINNSEKDLVVVAGSRLTVNGKVIDDNAAAGTIVVKSKNDEPTGTLLFKKPEQNQNVAATVEFYNKGYDCSDCGMYRRSWQYFALPLKNLDQFPAGDVDGEETINQWTEPFNGDKWRPATFPMTAFKGYEITNGSNTQPSDVYKMRGELVVGDATVPLTRTDGVNYAGVNLVGNSYTAAIDIKNGLTFPAEVQQTVYLFNTGTRDQWRKLDGSTVSGYQAGRYLAVPKNTAGTGNLPDRIPSMHAFMVRLESGTAANLGIIYNRLIENSTVNDGNGTQIAWRSAKNEKEKDVTNSIPTLIMDVLGGQSADRLWIFAKERSTFGFDNGWDGYKMAEAEITQLYALSNTPGEHFAVATVPALDNLKVGFEAPVEGNYTFEFALSGISSQSEIYLHDLAENRSVRVTDGASYSFDAKRGAYPQRFYLACSGNPLFQTDESSLIVLKAAESGTMAIANNSSRDCTLFISGLDGKLLQQVEVAAGEKRVVENLPGDLCIVRLQNAVVNEVRRVMVRE